MRSVAANLLICGDPEQAARETAERFVCAGVRSVALRGVFNVAVPGGSSPRRAFELLATGGFVDLVPWTRTHVFFTDERCVPPDDIESNYRLAFDTLLSHVPAPKSNIHRFRGELEPDEAAALYEHELRQAMGGPPRFDLVILGMGQDTHTASLFPNSPALAEHFRLAAANWIETLNAHRLTLTVPALSSAESIIIMALGTEKAEAVRTALQGEVNVEAHPVQAIRPDTGRLLWIVDQDAASELA